MLAELRREDGFTLVEVLIVCVLMLVVMGATLTTFDSFQQNVSTNQKQNEAQDGARNAMDLMARDLRNLASPTTEQPLALDFMGDQEIIFQSEGRDMPAGSLNVVNTNRVRYCVSTTGDLYRQLQTWTTAAFPAMPVAGACPGTGWTTTKLVAENVVNNARPIFYYNAALAPDVTEVTTTLYVDVNPGRTPGESTLQSSVYLRNQNRKPTAVFSLALANAGTAIIMNASESTDPEEKPLNFTWYIDGTEVVGEGANDVVHTAQVAAGTHTVKVTVSDGPLSDTSETQSICVPAPAQGVTCTPPSTP
jgi:prepilin-type N-terminal cleavage/methylation domain-containing protein